MPRYNTTSKIAYVIKEIVTCMTQLKFRGTGRITKGSMSTHIMLKGNMVLK